MTDSFARIAAEQAADEARWAAHPDPLSIAGDMQARAADRCARKRALWAAGHCESCPWRGCSTCEFQGGVDPNAPDAQRDSGATRRANQGVTKYAKGSRTAPAGAPTPEVPGPRPTEAAKPTDWTYRP